MTTSLPKKRAIKIGLYIDAGRLAASRSTSSGIFARSLLSLLLLA